MSKKVEFKEIIKIAETIKKDVEKNGKINTVKGYSKGQVLYILSKSVVKQQTSVTYSSIDYCKNCTGASINKNITKKEYTTLAKNIIKFIEANNIAPNYVTYQSIKIHPKIVLYAFSKIIVYYNTHKNTLPLTCWFKSSDFKTTTSSSGSSSSSSNTTSTVNCTNPYKALPYNSSNGCNAMGQDTGYYCACSMVQKMMYRLGYHISQEELARVMGTTTAGTGHDGIETGIAYCGRKFGVKFNVKWYNFSDLGWKKMGELMCQKNTSVGNHVLYRDQYGHYEYPLTVNTSEGTMKVINSLGSICSGSCYCGYIEERNQSTHRRYMSGISQKSVLVITKE